MAKKKIKVDGLEIRINQNDYVSLTDIAKRSSDREPSSLIQGWLRNQNTLIFLETWEALHNANFKPSQMAGFRLSATENRNLISAQKYIKATEAIGITSKSGRHGGTFAHSDIALNFCYWLSPKFQVYLIQEFQRLKAEEQLRLGDPFNIKRFLTSGNYGLLVTSLLSQVDERLLTHPQPYKKRLPFAAEADMINKIVFGNTSKEWRLHNTDKPTNRNQRDYASVLDLTVLNNLEFLDAMLIQWDVVELEERRNILQTTYDFIYPILQRSKTIKELQELANKALK
ncbi:MAG: KilA-N domain-containing protein [Saprospiraceae bacterium]